jgi:F-type H+-transporting ATPase subunit delta
LSRVAIRYSKALFELAVEQNLLEEVRQDLMLIREVCQNNPDFQQTLNNPLIEENVRLKIFEELFKANINPLTYTFLQLLSRKRRSSFLLEMIDDYLERVLEHKGILSCLLITPTSVEANQIETIKDRIETLTQKSVICNFQIDDTLIGGFIIKIKDMVIDLSIKTLLEKLRTQLIHG